MRVTKSTPTGSATRRTSHAPRLPTPVRRAVLTAQPTRPPAIVALRSAAPWDKAFDACATSPAALTRSTASPVNGRTPRSEEHTSELQSRGHLVCRLLLEKKNNTCPKTNQRERSARGHG